MTTHRTRLTKCLFSSQSEIHSTLSMTFSAWLCTIVEEESRRSRLNWKQNARETELCLLQLLYKRKQIITRISVNAQNGQMDEKTDARKMLPRRRNQL